MFANPSGSFTEEQSVIAQRVRQGNKLVDIDPSLHATADGRIVPKATSVGLEFSGGGSGPLATIIRDGRSMSLSWPAPLPKPTVVDDSVTYPEVLPGVDLKLRAASTGFGQLLVVKSAEAAANPALKSLTFKLSTTGVSVSADEHGNLRALNPAGQEVFTAPVPLMWDSSTSTTGGSSSGFASKPGARLPASAAETATPPVPTDEFEPGHGAQQSAMPLTVAGDTVTLAPDQSLLKGKNTTYPVYIDPPVDGSREAWTMAYKMYPNSSFYNGKGWGGSGSSTSTARVGYENETNGLARSFFQMDTDKLWNTRKSIIKSTFRIKNTWSWSCEDRKVEAWFTGSISSSTTWNNQPSWARYLNRVDDARGWSADCPAGNLAFDVTSAAVEAANRHLPNMTLGLRAADEDDVYAWKKFDVGTALLSTDYDTYPNKPGGLYTQPDSGAQCGANAPFTIIGNTDITLGGTFSDPDGGTVKAHFELWPTGHGGAANEVNTTVDVTSGRGAKLVVTKDRLAQLMKNAGLTGTTTFSWQAQTQSGPLSSPWADECHFQFDGTRPSNPPGVTSSQYPDGSEGWPSQTGQARTEGAFTFSSGNVGDVAKYEYWSDWDPTVRTASPAAVGGSVSIKLTPPSAGAHALGVRSLDRAGNRSDGTAYRFYANSPATPDKPGDLNGDGTADFYGIRTDGALWLYPGQGNGYAGASALASNTDFSGASVTHRGAWSNYDLAAPGDRTGDGRVDVIARSKSNGELRQYQGTGPNGEGLGYGPGATVIGTSWTPAYRPLFTAVPDTNGDGKPDLWSTGGDGKLYFYSNVQGVGVEVGIGGWKNFQQIS